MSFPCISQSGLAHTESGIPHQSYQAKTGTPRHGLAGLARIVLGEPRTRHQVPETLPAATMMAAVAGMTGCISKLRQRAVSRSQAALPGKPSGHVLWHHRAATVQDAMLGNVRFLGLGLLIGKP